LEQFQPPGDTGVPEDPEGEALSTPLRERPDAPLGTLIFRAGLLPAEAIENALEEGVKTGKRLGEILTERGLLQEADLARLLAGQKGLSFVTLREQIVDPAAAGLFSEDQARLFRALPYTFEDGVPVVAIADPTDDVLTRNVREALARDDAKFVVSIRSELAEIIGEVYAEGVSPAAAPAPQPEAPSVPDMTGSDPGVAASDGADLDDSAQPAPPPVAEPPAPEPVAEAPVPAAPSLPDTTGSDSVIGSDGWLEPTVNGHHETGLVSPEVVPAPQPEPFPAPAPELMAAPAPEPAAAPAPTPMAAPGPEPVPAPAARPEPDPVPAAAPEHVATATPQPAEPPTVEPVVAETQAQPVAPAAVRPPEAAPVGPESVPAPPPESLPQPQPAPAAGTGHRLSVRLTNGERVEVGGYDDLEAAKVGARALIAQIAAADGGDWPFVSGRFLKPDTIVSVDIS
jgi:hypothetical protein